MGGACHLRSPDSYVHGHVQSVGWERERERESERESEREREREAS